MEIDLPSLDERILGKIVHSQMIELQKSLWRICRVEQKMSGWACDRVKNWLVEKGLIEKVERRWVAKPAKAYSCKVHIYVKIIKVLGVKMKDRGFTITERNELTTPVDLELIFDSFRSVYESEDLQKRFKEDLVRLLMEEGDKMLPQAWGEVQYGENRWGEVYCEPLDDSEIEKMRAEIELNKGVGQAELEKSLLDGEVTDNYTVSLYIDDTDIEAVKTYGNYKHPTT